MVLSVNKPLNDGLVYIPPVRSFSNVSLFSEMAVAKMVQRMLRLETTPQFDASDALAVALAFGMESQSPIALGQLPKQI